MVTADSLAEAAALRTAEPRRLPRVGREPAFLHSRGVGAHGPGRLWPSSGGSLRLASFCLETRLHFVSFQAALSVMSRLFLSLWQRLYMAWVWAEESCVFPETVITGVHN